MTTTVDDYAHSSAVEALTQLRDELVRFVAQRVENAEAAEDIVQDILERAHRADLSELGNPAAWFYRAARNAIVDHYRTRRFDAPLPPDFSSDAPMHGDVEQGAPNEATQELARCMRPLVERLPEPYRRALTLVDLEARTHAGAALIESVSVSGMKSRVQRGRDRLGVLLGECCAVATTPAGAVSSYTRRAPECC